MRDHRRDGVAKGGGPCSLHCQRQCRAPNPKDDARSPAAATQPAANAPFTRPDQRRKHAATERLRAIRCLGQRTSTTPHGRRHQSSPATDNSEASRVATATAAATAARSTEQPRRKRQPPTPNPAHRRKPAQPPSSSHATTKHATTADHNNAESNTTRGRSSQRAAPLQPAVSIGRPQQPVGHTHQTTCC